MKMDSNINRDYYEDWIDNRYSTLLKVFERCCKLNSNNYVSSINNIDSIRMRIRLKFLSYENLILTKCYPEDKKHLHTYLHNALINLDTQTLDWFNSKSSPKRS